MKYRKRPASEGDVAQRLVEAKAKAPRSLEQLQALIAEAVAAEGKTKASGHDIGAGLDDDSPVDGFGHDDFISTFDVVMRSAVRDVFDAWGYPQPGSSWHEEFGRRMPAGLRQVFGRGPDDGLIQMVDGFRFTMRDRPPGKGRYALLSRSPNRMPAPNWEYVIQTVGYVRAHDSLAHKGYLIGVEDSLMDVTVRSPDGTLLWYIESKESSKDLNKLVREIAGWGTSGVDFTVDDRHKDGLRKAKYLLAHRPVYFSGSAIGVRLDFRVLYTGPDRFSLQEDVVPYV